MPRTRQQRNSPEEEESIGVTVTDSESTENSAVQLNFMEMMQKMDQVLGKLTNISDDLATYVNPEKLFPKRKGIQAWIIGVAVSAGLLLLLLLIILLWWCGFFRRKRPEEKAYLSPQNGQYKAVAGGPPDEKYRYM